MHNSTYTPRTSYSLRVDTRLVEVGVVVRDRAGHAVGGLTRDQFEIEADGKKREIVAFTAEGSAGAPAAAAAPSPPSAPAASPSPAPRFLGLLFDDFAMGPAELVPARIAARRFLRQGVAPNDQVAIFSTAKGQIVPFTTDTAKLAEAIEGLSLAQRGPDTLGCPVIAAYDAYLIANHLDPTVLPAKMDEAVRCGACIRRDRNCAELVEARASAAWAQVRDTSLRTMDVIKSVVDFMAKMPGRRVLLLTSSGFLSGTLEREQSEITDRALRGEVVINALDAKGLFTQDMGVQSGGGSMRSIALRQSQGTRPQDAANDALAVLAYSTGGLFFHNNNDLDQGFHDLGLAPSFSYSLGVSADKADNRYHHLKVRLKASGSHNVQARPGYFAASEAAPPAGPMRKIDQEVLSSDILQDMPALINAGSGTTPAGETGVRIVIHLDLQNLHWDSKAGVRSQKVTVVAALFDEKANFITGKESQMDFHLKDDTFQRMAQGLNAGLTLIAPPGRYRLRTVVEEAAGGRLAATAQPVEIRRD